LLLKTNPLLRLSWAGLALLALFAPLPGAAFDLKDTQGHVHRLADYQGRWVVVTCIEEIPEIAAFQKDHPRVVVIGVAVDAENGARVKQFARKLGHDYPLVLSDESVEKQLGEPRALPSTRIYDPSGKVVYDRVGRINRKSLEELTASRPPAKA
jgi:peroxiredoxin